MTDSIPVAAALQGGGEPLRSVLQRVASEVRRQADALTRLDAEIGAMASEASFRGGPAMQEADLVRQEIGGLADFLAAITESLPPDWRCNAVAASAGLTVQAQAARLAGRAAAETATPSPRTDLWLD